MQKRAAPSRRASRQGRAEARRQAGAPPAQARQLPPAQAGKHAHSGGRGRAATCTSLTASPILRPISHAVRPSPLGRQAPPPARRAAATPPSRAESRPYAVQSVPEVPGAALASRTRRCCSISARSSAPTSRSSASGSAASCSSRTCSPSSTGTCAPARSTRCPSVSTRGSRTPTAASTACSAGTCFDFLARRRPRRWRGRSSAMLRPGGAVMGFFSTARRAARRSRSTRSSTTTVCGTGHHAGAGGPKHVLHNRDIIRMFDGCNVSDSFLLKNNTREILPQT